MEEEQYMPKLGGLQITRKVGQAILLLIDGVEVRIEIRSIGEKNVRVGVIAPAHKVQIRREEQVK